MSNRQSIWTPEVTARLKELTMQGLTRHQIAKRLSDVPGATYWAVKAKIEREKWRRPRRVPLVKKVNTVPVPIAAPADDREKRLLALHRADHAEHCAAAEIDAAPLVDDILLLTDEKCVYPYREPPTAWCGRDVKPREGRIKYRYCAYHQRLVSR